MKIKITTNKLSGSIIIACLAIICSAVLGVFVSSAIFSDGKTDSAPLIFNVVELNAQTSQNSASQINFQLTDQYLLSNDILFAKSEESTDIYVRASIKFTTDLLGNSIVAKDIIKYQQFSPATPGTGYVWTQWGEYYYLMDESNTTNLKPLTTTANYKFLEAESLIVPVGVENNYSSDPVFVNIEFEAIGAFNVETPTISGVANIFSNTPNSTHNVIIKNSAGQNLNTYSSAYGSTVTLASGNVLANETGKTFELNTKVDGTGATIPFTNVNGTYYINNITQDLTIYQFQRPNIYEIVATAGINGTISPEYTCVEYGSDIDFIIIPASGYEINTFTNNNIAVSMDNIENNGNGSFSYTISSITQAHNLVVTFAEESTGYTVSGSGDGSYCSYSLDNGTTWVTINNVFSLSNVTQIKFKASAGSSYGIISSTTLGFALNGNGKSSDQISDNYILSGNISDISYGYGYGICCFVAGTQISMADGTTKNIEDIKQGDKILSYNFENQNLVETTVSSFVIMTRFEIYTLKFKDGTTLTLTNDHPIYSERGWVCVDAEKGKNNYSGVEIEDESMSVADKIFSLSLLFNKEIESIQENKYSEGITVYTFGVNILHNFFANECLSHNAPCPPVN